MQAGRQAGRQAAVAKDWSLTNKEAGTGGKHIPPSRNSKKESEWQVGIYRKNQREEAQGVVVAWLCNVKLGQGKGTMI